MSDNEDNDIAPPLRVAAIQLNEMYNELKDAGFSRREALFLVSRVLVSGAEES